MMDNSLFGVLSTTVSSVQLASNYTVSLSNQLVQSVGDTGSDAATTTNHGIQ